MNGGRFFLDSNILVYAQDNRFPEKQSKAQDMIFSGMRARKCVISTQVLSEFFVTVTQKIEQPLAESKAKREIIFLSQMDVIEIDVTLVTRAIDIKSQWKLGYWDSLILAAAERGQCDEVISENFTQKQNYGSIRIHNIFT